MRWEDERYVRFYTRDTPEWLALTWRARALFGLILRAVDRAGLLKVGKLGLKGVAVSIHAPWVEVEEALNELLADGCVRFDEGQGLLFLPNFLAAQECPQSDKARKRASRERAAAEFGGSQSASEAARVVVTKRDHIESQDVTHSGHVSGQNVTPGHAASHAVTPTHAVPCRAVPKETLAPNNGAAPHKQRRPKSSDPEQEALEADLSIAYHEAKGEDLDWPGSAHGELQAIRKALGSDVEVKRRWGLFLASKFWPTKNIHFFRDAFQNEKFQKPAAQSDRPSVIPEYR